MTRRLRKDMVRCVQFSLGGLGPFGSGKDIAVSHGQFWRDGYGLSSLGWERSGEACHGG